jgi:hypothetical protein
VVANGQSLKAKQFLIELESRLAAQSNVRERVDRENAVRLSGVSEKHKVACRENIWLYFVALSEVHQALCKTFNLTEKEARRALGGEYHAKFPEFLGHNPFRQHGHVLPKSKQANSSIVMKWLGDGNKLPLFQSFPDLAIAEPAPCRIVFDAKYYVTGDPQKALLNGVEEVAYYRGLPRTREGGSLYDFGCLLAYDASEKGELWRLWQEIGNKDQFWNSANIQPIILREGI